MTEPLTWAPVRNLGIYSRRSGSRKVIETYNDAYALSDTGAFIWSRTGTGATVADLAAWVAARYDVDEERARADVQGFLSELVSLGFLEPYPAADGSPAGSIRRPGELIPDELTAGSVCAFACPVPAAHPDAAVTVVVTDRRPELAGEAEVERSSTGPVPSYQVGTPDGGECTVQFWQSGQLEALLSRFQTSIPSQEDSQPESADEELLRRLVTGVPLAGDARFAEYRRALKASGYALWYAENHKYIAENNLEDVAGMLSVGDIESAAMTVYSAFTLALEARLALGWDLSPVREDFLARITAAPFSPLERDAVTTVLLWRGYLTAPRRWVDAAARTAEGLLIAVEQRWFA
ncbi:PqqD family protein [Jatrophihabitans sp.]|uniref:PqqD family protein n=1 Tax=Jatrophihabitans sp. TaxID=1932789 RepID=UPI002D12BEC3|nr:PqqD family protein [Jatrophihabitans sp.]